MRNRLLKKALFYTFLLCAVSVMGQDAALEQAKTLFGQGKYGEVLEISGKESSRNNPNIDLMKLGMEANMKLGKPVSANTLATELLKKTGSRDLDLVFRAAEIAETCGDSRLAISRYYTYVTENKTASGAKMEQAYTYLMKHSSYIDVYIAGVKIFGPELYWPSVHWHLTRLINEQSINEFVALMQFALQTYAKTPEAMNHIGWLLSVNKDKFSNTDNIKIMDAIVNIPTPRSFETGHLHNYLRHVFKQTDASRQTRWMLQYLTTNQYPLPAEFFNTPISEYIKARETPEKKMEAAKEFIPYLAPLAKSGNQDVIRRTLLDIVNSPEAFRTVITPEQLGALFVAYGKTFPAGYFPGELGIVNTAVNSFYKDDKPNQLKFLAVVMPYLDGSWANTAINLDPEQSGRNLLNIYLGSASGFQKELDEFNVLPSFRVLKMKPESMRVLKSYLAAGFFNPNAAAAEIIHNDFLTPAEKIKIVTEAARISGSSARLSELIKAMETNAKFKDQAEAMAELKTFAEQKKAGSDAVITAANKVFDVPVKAENIAALDKAADEFLQAYKGKVPASELLAENLHEYVAFHVMRHNLGIANVNVDALNRMALRWTPRLSTPGTAWTDIINNVWNKEGQDHKGKTSFQLFQNYIKTMLPFFKAGYSFDFEWILSTQQTGPVKQDLSIMIPLYADYPVSSLGYVWQNRNEWTADFYFKQLGEILKDPNGKLTLDQAAGAVDTIYNGPHKENISDSISLLLMQRIMDASKRQDMINLDFEVKPYARYNEGNKNYIQEYVKRVKERTPYQQMRAMNEFFARRAPAHADGAVILTELLKPLYDAPPAQWREITIYPQVLSYVNALAKSDALDDGMKKTAETTLAAMCRGLLDGNASMTRDYSTAYPEFLIPELKNQKEKWDYAKLAQGVGVVSQSLENDTDQNRGLRYLDSIYNIIKDDPVEIQYALLSNQIKGTSNYNKAVKDRYTLTISRLARDIPGILPVDRNDQAYDLFLASQMLKEGNALNAWALVRPKTALIKERWKEFDYDFVIWALDQTRKQKMHKDALDIAMTIWLDEMKLSAEDAAKLAIIKGDIYRDMQNFPPARIEYESLKNNPRYAATEAGMMAKFRLVELLILTRDFSAARLELERLIDSRTLTEQAEAYYFLARLEFEQQEYESTRDYLKKVFNRVWSHPEARLLEGELSLATNVIKSPIIPLGDVMLRTVAIPGREITFQIQDNNLSIVRGGKSIPVIVKTTVGKDVERLELLPNANDTNLFSGVLQTTLGKAVPGNLLLELTGSDEVEYQIDPEFQKANGLDYPVKKLEIKYPAKLYASSKKVLSEEEQDELNFNAMLALSAGVRDRNANNKVVRPGSPIYIRVIDLDMSTTPGKPDTVMVDLESSSGDELKAFVLTETGPYTGIFEGIVPTGIPYPHAMASDAMENVDVNSVININKKGSWRSLPDGAKPKWLEVDTMTSYNFKEIEITVPNRDMIKAFTLTASLDKDDDIICSYPQDAEKKNLGGLTVRVQGSSEAGLQQLQNNFRRARTAAEYRIDSPEFSREDVNQKGKDGWNIYEISGFFWLEANAELGLRFLQPADHNQFAYLLIDNQLVLGGSMNEVGVAVTRTLFLSKGLHSIKILARDHSKDSKIILGMSQKDGTFTPLPAEWFNPENNAEFAGALKPKGEVMEISGGFRVTLSEPMRYRKLKWTFEDYNGNQLEVLSVAAKDDTGKTILPVENDLTTGKTNRILEVAADDAITVTYHDEKNIDENKTILTDKLNSSFNNASIQLCFEDIRMTDEGYPVTHLTMAKRVQKGDTVVVVVVDYDEDTSDDLQTVPVEISTSSGEKMTLTLLEDKNNGGRFTQIFKVGDKTEKGMIKLESGDILTAKYLDKENNSPGIPVHRQYSVLGISGSRPEITLYGTKINMIEDRSPVALAKIQAMKARGDKREDIKLYKEEIVATAIPPKPQDSDAPIIINGKTPLLFELTYPEVAKHERSTAEVSILTQTEINAAKSENREPRPLKVNMPLQSLTGYARTKGYSVTMSNKQFLSHSNILDLGIFAGVIRLQLGSIGDEINDIVSSNEAFNILNAEIRMDDSAFRVPTVIVSGSDTIFISVNDKAGKLLTSKTVKLRSDGEIGLYDKNFLTESSSIHLGQNFYIRVYDPDRDVTDALDKLQVKVKSAAGDSLTMDLTETLPHSGIFTGVLSTELQPKAGADGAVPAKAENNILRTAFGDTVTFTYVDEIPLEGDKPVEVACTGTIVIGSDGEVSTFTKKFKDPDMAVKTNFLMAEALFEMAKSHRAMKKFDLANEEIARGKRILEEALRDYPNTSLKAQGEFLLANLAQQLENFQEAIGRYSIVISTWPDSEYAVKSQFQKAQCLEKMDQGIQACEEYVKLTYLYPDSSLVADAKIRLGNFYYKNKRYKSAATIFKKFAENHPSHNLAAKSLFLAGNSELKNHLEMDTLAKENGQTYRPDYTDAIKIFNQLIDNYQDDKDLRAEAMYWLGDTYFKSGTEEGKEKSYQVLKKLTWDYPESRWAKIARGRMSEQPVR